MVNGTGAAFLLCEGNAERSDNAAVQELIWRGRNFIPGKGKYENDIPKEYIREKMDGLNRGPEFFIMDADFQIFEKSET